MRSMQTAGLLVGSLTAILGLTSSAQDVRTDYDQNAKLNQFRTYRWGQVQTNCPFSRSRITEEIDKQLQEKACQRVPSRVDRVLKVVSARHNQQQSHLDNPGAGRWWVGFSQATTKVENYAPGLLSSWV